MSQPEYKLYGAEVSYFTAKARAYLRWRGVPFEAVNATRDVYQSVIMPNVGWPVIPVMKTPDGKIVQDSADIIKTVEEEAGLSPSVLPQGPLQRFVSELIHLFADEWLVLPAMHYRWTYNEDWAYGEFGKMSAPDKSPEEQFKIGAANGERFKGALPVLGVHPETIPGIEASYQAFLDEFSAHLTHHAYVFGGRPSLADFALIGPLYAHLWRDPKSRDIMEARAPKVADWVHRVNAGEQGEGELLPDDQIPDTLIPILARQAREQYPALRQTLALFDNWAATAEAESAVPRALGQIKAEIEGHTGPAAARSFPLYRLQAAIDVFDAMGPDDQQKTKALLDRIGGQGFESLKPSKRLTRRNYRLALA